MIDFAPTPNGVPADAKTAVLDSLAETVQNLRVLLLGANQQVGWLEDAHAAWRTNTLHSLDTIYRFVESPIERRLFTALVYSMTKRDPAALQVVSPADGVLKRIDQQKRMQDFVDLVTRPTHFERGRAGLTRVDEILAGDPLLRSMSYHSSVTLMPQARIVLPELEARVDGLLWAPGRVDLVLAIEADGFAYHNDKEQFAIDRQRDRVLETHGIETRRFCGREINADPCRCARELIETIMSKRGVWLGGAA